MTSHYVLGQKKIIVKYYNERSGESLSCSQCDWEGHSSFCERVTRGNQEELSCPHCSTMLALISEVLQGEAFKSSTDTVKSGSAAGAEEVSNRYSSNS